MKKIVFLIGDESHAFFTNISRYDNDNEVPVASLYANIMSQINEYCIAMKLEGKIADPVLVEVINNVWTVTFPKPDYHV